MTLLQGIALSIYTDLTAMKKNQIPDWQPFSMILLEERKHFLNTMILFPLART